jgi:hypothetical protein
MLLATAVAQAEDAVMRDLHSAAAAAAAPDAVAATARVRQLLGSLAAAAPILHARHVTLTRLRARVAAAAGDAAQAVAAATGLQSAPMRAAFAAMVAEELRCLWHVRRTLALYAPAADPHRGASRRMRGWVRRAGRESTGLTGCGRAAGAGRHRGGAGARARVLSGGRSFCVGISTSE